MMILKWIGLILIAGILIADLIFIVEAIQETWDLTSIRGLSVFAESDGIVMMIILTILVVIGAACVFGIFKILNISYGLTWYELKHLFRILYTEIKPFIQQITIKGVLSFLLGIGGLVAIGYTGFFWLFMHAGLGGHHASKMSGEDELIAGAILLLGVGAGLTMIYFSIRNLFF